MSEKQAVIMIRLNPDVKARFQAVAKKSRRTTASLIRCLIEEVADGNLDFDLFGKIRIVEQPVPKKQKGIEPHKVTWQKGGQK